MTQPLTFTGERFIPGVQGEIWLEHWHRYLFASRWAAGKRVLDVACGEGYGSALLARSAAHVTGVDVSEQAVAHARAAYAQVANLEFVAASCTRMPLPDGALDVVVSFETLEHIEAQDAFMDEIARVLAPGGVLLLSCPNKVEYTDKRDYHNEYHVKELYRDELQRLVARRFPHAAWYGQRLTFHSVIAPESPAGAGEFFESAKDDPAGAARAQSAPLYYLLVAAREAAAVSALPAPVSVMADRDDFLYNDYAKVIRELRAMSARCDELERATAAAKPAAPAGWWQLALRRFGILKP